MTQDKEQLNPTEEPTKPTPKPVEFSPDQQEVLNREIAEAKRKERERYAAELEAERARIEKEAREASLLEKEDFKKLSEERGKELAALKQQLEARDLDNRTMTLLDNAGITSPYLRKLALALPADLEKRAEYIKDLHEHVEAETEAKVNERLKTPRPDKVEGTVSKKLKDMTPAEKVAWRNEHGDEAFVKKTREEATARK